MSLYFCRGEDGEDLTDAVNRARGGGKHWKVVVTCSKGHANTFGGPEPGDSDVVAAFSDDVAAAPPPESE